MQVKTSMARIRIRVALKKEIEAKMAAKKVEDDKKASK